MADDGRTGFITLILWIWTQVKRSFSYMDARNRSVFLESPRILMDIESSFMVDTSPKSQLCIDLDGTESTDDFIVFGATRNAMNEVMEALRDPEVTSVGVFGMGGAGKTTMVAHVAAQACRNGMFNHCIMVTVSQKPNFIQIQSTLSDILGAELGEQTEAVRAARLHKEIMRREKLLIILDDVWDNILFRKIGIPNSKELQNIHSKVILTTRRTYVLYVMKCHRKIKLNNLSKQDSWDLFVRKARRSFASTEFENAARMIVTECKGLPIVLILVARALRDKNLGEWEAAAKRLEKSQTASLEGICSLREAGICSRKMGVCSLREMVICSLREMGICSLIKFSYDHLEEKSDKEFFLLCCLFPEDYKIKIQELFRNANGIGLLRDVDTLEEAMERAKTIANRLRDSCLLLDGGDESCVYVHDAVRNTAIQIIQSDQPELLVKIACGLEDFPSQVHDNYTDSHPSSSSCIPSSSTAPPTQRWKYDVFLSFRGRDTRMGITVDIRDRLQSKGIRTFMDDPDLRVGDTISPALLAAIQDSQFAIVVLSQNYASSTWCLKELVKICKCMGNENRIFPLFYHVDPTDVRYQKKGSFQKAFSKHKASNRHDPATLKYWRDALKQVANISGWSTNDFNTHRELVDKIVESFSSKVPPDTIEYTDDFHAYESTRVAMDEVKKALIDEEVIVVGVYGMGGVGKTTMVTHVAAQACRNGTFNQWIMVTASQNPDFIQIQDTLSDILGAKLGKETEARRATRLHKEIMRKEKLLIILDDVWDNILFQKIGIPNFKELQNVHSKVILTTRRRNVLHVMKCHRKIKLNILSQQDSWDLFVSKARRSFASTEFENVAKEVARECGGLPIALITVAIALGDKEEGEWKTAAKRLEKSQTANPDDDGAAFECIRLSYDYLKHKDYKSFFLLCCLFPEDHNIRIEDLFKYGMGIGLFQDADTLEEARERAKTLARHLQDSSLLLDGRDERYVKMHDVVRDAALQIPESEHGYLVKARCGLNDWPRQLHEDYFAISLMDNYISKVPENLSCPKLQILLLHYNRIGEIPETFFRSPNELRVLDLSWINSLSLLPQSFNLLTNLQALYLDWCDSLAFDTSILGNLRNLEILSMRNLCLEELSIELGGLTKLRMFDNTVGKIGRISPRVISKWLNLEEIYIKGFGDWGSETNASFDEVTSLLKLRVMEVTISDAEYIPKSVKVSPNWVELDIIVGGSVGWRFSNRCSISAQQMWLKDVDNMSHLPEWFRNKIMKIAASVG